MKLTDLEICKRIAEIEGKDFYLLESGEDVYPMIKLWYGLIQKRFHGSSDYNPLTDDALCFRLGVKHNMFPHLNAETCMFECIYDADKLFYHGGGIIEDKSPNKAICLAIIEANKDK